MKISLQAKIGMLMTLAILIISATGYLSFRSLSSIVSSIQVKSKPDMRLIIIREITSDLEKAENSVRMFIHTRNQKDIAPYYSTIALFDSKVERLHDASLKDTVFLNQIDTISKLMEENIVNWNLMLTLYHNDSVDNYIRKLSTRMAVAASNDKNNEGSILRRVFGKKTLTSLDQNKIIRDLNTIERQDSIKNTQLLTAEAHLAKTGNEIRERFYMLISKMEEEVNHSLKNNALAADKLALQTYRWLAGFTILGSLLVIMVLIIVARYVRRSRDYQKALIKSKEETEKLAQMREQFMANMSHEIRTPVNAIYGFSEQLLHRSFDDKNRQILQIIKSSADHLVKLVNDILDFSKLQAGKIVLEPGHFEIKKAFEEVQLLFETRAVEKNTRLYHTISESTPPVLFGDSYRLKQILFNLVGNSVKFTKEGEIHFSVDIQKQSADGFNLILKVSDTGIGIRQDMQHKVFDDFTQEETDTSKKYGGTGLGLSIVKKLVELHHGSISLESKKNKGTLITCIMPYTKGNVKQLPALIPVLQIPGQFRKLKILIVDDEEYNRLLFKTILDRWRVQYDEAGDGQTAIDLVKTNRYNMVFMDIRMPQLDGLMSTVFIRKELKRTEEELPVIGISATHTAEDIQKYRSAGMNTFLSKPFTEKMLLEVMSSLLIDDHSEPAPAVLEEEPAMDPDVDLSDLYHLANHDKPFIRIMLAQFIESTERGLKEIVESVEKGEVKNAADTAHKISAPCKHVGAKLLYSYLKSIEKYNGRNDGLSELIKLSADSNKEFEIIKNFLQAHLMKMSEQ
jgi:signal transduction histidine kinase/HPt (histidine-containing phosphotransfer) domain-containing protein/ActR/RegA family two-component response regulator